jgi:glutaredoxin
MPETVTVLNTPGCVFCEYAMHTLEQMLKDEKTKEKIEIALDNICKVMPKSVEVSSLQLKIEYQTFDLRHF